MCHIVKHLLAGVNFAAIHVFIIQFDPRKISVDKQGSGYEAYPNRVGRLLPRFDCMLPIKLVQPLKETSKIK